MTEPTPDPTGDLVEVARLGNLPKARLLCSRLQAAGIRTLIPGESTMDLLDGAAVIWSEGVPVFVSAADADAARDIMAALEELRGRDDEGPEAE